MPANVLFPEDWDVILSSIRSGDDEKAKAILIERERRLDGYFSAFDYVPVLTQGGAAIACTVRYAKVFRAGHWVWVDAEVVATAAGAGGNIALSLPIALPGPVYAAGAGHLAGTFSILDTGTAEYVGKARLATATTVIGQSYGAGAPMGSALPLMTIAVGDAVGVVIAYPTTATTL